VQRATPGVPGWGHHATYDRRLQGDEFAGTDDGRGSASAGRARNVIAGKLTLNMNDREADVRGGQWTTHS